MKSKIWITPFIYIIIFVCAIGENLESNKNDEKKINFGLTVTLDTILFDYPELDGGYNPGNLDDDIFEYLDESTEKSASEKVGEGIGFENMHYIRMDLSANAQINPKTKLNTLTAFKVMGRDSGAQDDFSYTILNCNIEHKINDKYTIKAGRVVEKYSESKMFGRVALGAKDAHVFGRTPFINDSVQLGIDLDKLKLNTGLKYEYKELGFNAIYMIGDYTNKVGKKKENELGLTGIYSINRQVLDDYKDVVPEPEDEQDDENYYQGLEGEVSLKLNNNITGYFNAGLLLNYIGKAPHFSGPTDILKGNEPIIYEGSDSAEETFSIAMGIRLDPSKYIKCLPKLTEFMTEFEFLGLASDNYDGMITYCHLNYKLTDSIDLQYGLYINNMNYNGIENLYNSDGKVLAATEELTSFVNFIRITAPFSI